MMWLLLSKGFSEALQTVRRPFRFSQTCNLGAPIPVLTNVDAFVMCPCMMLTD